MPTLLLFAARVLALALLLPHHATALALDVQAVADALQEDWAMAAERKQPTSLAADLSAAARAETAVAGRRQLTT